MSLPIPALIRLIGLQMCLCVGNSEREGGREGGRERARMGGGEGGGERERVSSARLLFSAFPIVLTYS